MANSPRVCIDKIIGRPPPQYESSQPIHKRIAGLEERARIAILWQKMWPPHKRDRLTVRFLEGDPYIQEKVQKKAEEWSNYANIKFQFVRDKQDADIQIAFQLGAGSWSMLGTDADLLDPGEATMNFGWLDVNTPDKEYSRVVKHEFGHALGLIHEHQNPGGNGIKWNKEAVYTALGGPPNNWDRETIDLNMFERYAKNITNFTDIDPKSIMTYWIPPEWTTDGKSYGEDVFDLSDTDKEFIKSQYKKDQ
jgi:serralysin